MNEKQLKMVTKRIMKEILAKKKHYKIFELLSVLNEKASAKTEKDFEAWDISEIVQQQCSKEEIRDIRDFTVKAIKKELEKGHSCDSNVSKKQSYYITTRLMIALWMMDENLEAEFSKMNNREKFCYKYIYILDIDICINMDEILTLVSYLDS